MIKYLGTHNSGTSSKLVWWQRPFGYLLNLTSRCQNLSIDEQLKNNVRLFNLQVAFYKKEWVFSHGMCIYTGKMYDAISKMVQYATTESPVYFQLFLDKNFLLGQNKEEFRKMVDDLNDELKDTNVYMLYAYIEGTNEYPYRSNIKLNASEHYWTTSWADDNAKSWIDKLPLPKRHAKIYNDKYSEENKADYLMLDFIEIGNHKTTTTSKKPITTTTSRCPVTTTTTWFPTLITTEAGRLELVNGNKKHLFKNGFNFSITVNEGQSKTIMFDAINGYPAPNNMTALSDNSKIALSSLSIFYRNITISGVKPGKTKIYIATTYKDVHYEGYINVTIKAVTTTTSKKPITTTTSSKFPTTTTWRPTHTTTL